MQISFFLNLLFTFFSFYNLEHGGDPPQLMGSFGEEILETVPPPLRRDPPLHLLSCREPTEQVTRCHIIVEDGWAGASNPHPHLNPPPTLKHRQQVIQGSHMVSGTRCPAWIDWLKKWSESRAAAPKGQCPVGHRGEIPYVLRGHI